MRPTCFRAAARGEWLHLAAAPVFALMALLTMLEVDGAPMTCMGGPSPLLGSMGLMYLLMSIFHLAPWLEAWRRVRARPGLEPGD